MTDHLRYAGQDPAAQDRALREIIALSPHLQCWLKTMHDLRFPDSWIVSGAIYNQVWNHLTGRPLLYGIKDVDLFYFDPDLSPDLSYDAEDNAIRQVARADCLQSESD